jgi:predicted alpha/beta-hydrolase family hydrolase
LTRSTELSVPLETGTAVTALVYRSAEPSLDAALILAHGAGAGQRSAFMAGFAAALAASGIDTVTFDFPYMQERRRIPDRAPVLESCYRRVVAAVVDRLPSAQRALFIGGKSMGGRIATQIAAESVARPSEGRPDDVARPFKGRLRGIVLLGYPLHPPGRPEQRRDKHLPLIDCPLLFVQGSRDTFGTPQELEPVLRSLKHQATLHVVDGGDHSFKVRQAARQAAVYEEVQQAIADWIRGRR